MQRVYRAVESDTEAPRRPQNERPRAEAAELVEVRALLCELRPGGGADTNGPLGWSPLAPEPRHTEPPQGALARRIRVQTSVGPSDGPRDAFAAGATDYLPKPFGLSQLRTRARSSEKSKGFVT